jgi:ubiquinone/menaquinone biosynthesis C-methylase UbiE
MTDESHYLWLAGAYARGRLGLPAAVSDEAAIAAGASVGLRMHRFKRTGELARVRRVIGALRGIGATRILDVGSGRGAFLWPLVDAMPELGVLAIDLLQHRVADIDAVRRGGVARVAAVRMDATALAVRDGAMDVVTLLEVLEHMPDPVPAAREAVRVATRAVIATVPSKEDDNPEHLRVFTADGLSALLRDAGLARVTTDHVLGHVVAVGIK